MQKIALGKTSSCDINVCQTWVWCHWSDWNSICNIDCFAALFCFCFGMESTSKELHLDQVPEAAEHIQVLAGDQLSINWLCTLKLIQVGHESRRNAMFWGAWIPGLFHAKIADALGTSFVEIDLIQEHLNLWLKVSHIYNADTAWCPSLSRYRDSHHHLNWQLLQLPMPQLIWIHCLKIQQWPQVKTTAKAFLLCKTDMGLGMRRASIRIRRLVLISVAGAWLGSAEPWLWSPGKQAELSSNGPEAASDSQLWATAKPWKRRLST